jgi:hypothetical protein
MTADPTRLRFGPYAPPPLARGDRAFRLYRDCDVVVTGSTAARLPWPFCRSVSSALDETGLLASAELERAVMSEAAGGIGSGVGHGRRAGRVPGPGGRLRCR